VYGVIQLVLAESGINLDELLIEPITSRQTGINVFGAARRIGRALSAAGDPLAARVRPVAWGMTAALVATLVANFFYLTMSFYYFYVFATLAAALATVASRAQRA
jgi:hypothetical protein